ncbi:MAG: hypothetical protein AAFZ15_24550 [Bacteroidota bacterium]
MKRTFQSFVEETATFKNTLLFGVLCLTMALFIMPEAVREISLGGAEDAHLLDNVIFSTPARMYRMIGDYGEIGRKLYLAVELTADLFYSIVLTLFLGSLMVFSNKLCERKVFRFRQIVWLSTAVLLVNWLENGLIIWMLIHYPAKYVLLCLATSFFTALKWSLILVCQIISCWNLLNYYLLNVWS